MIGIGENLTSLTEKVNEEKENCCPSVRNCINNISNFLIGKYQFYFSGDVYCARSNYKCPLQEKREAGYPYCLGDKYKHEFLLARNKSK